MPTAASPAERGFIVHSSTLKQQPRGVRADGMGGQAGGRDTAEDGRTEYDEGRDDQEEARC